MPSTTSSALTAPLPTETLTALRRELLAYAFLHDHPQAYIAGVEDALSALERRLPTAGQFETDRAG